MISYLNGKLILKTDKFVIVDVGGVGYKVFLSKKSMAEVPVVGEPLKLFCHLNVKENIMDLYGFLSYKQLEFFEILENIRGVGPKIALEISALGSLDELKDRLLNPEEREFVLQGIPGLGKKRAMTIILELTGKIKEVKGSALAKASADEAEDGLINLGFPKVKAQEVLKEISKKLTTEERVQEALKILGNERIG